MNHGPAGALCAAFGPVLLHRQIWTVYAKRSIVKAR